MRWYIGRLVCRFIAPVSVLLVQLAFLIASFAGVAPLFAQETAKDKKQEFPGEKTIVEYFKLQVKKIAEPCLLEYQTKEQWEKARPELRRQLWEMLGLWPLPAKTDLKPVITGKVEREKYTIEKIHFQSAPNLYVMANLYIPKPAPRNAPTILYVCGHGNVVKDGVSFGSKVHYQHHPAWFAEHGYVAMVIDTLQLSEIPGIHHGTYREKMWWWHTLGYTPAGIECWNGIRALDYLESRPEVDPKRIGVTGRSGGGAYSWWLAAADDRPACIIPVAGIADLQAQLNEGYPGRLAKGVIAGHCDCMFMVNSYRWDFPMVAALCAPRPLMLGNTDIDDIFPVPGYRRIADKVRKIYSLYGAPEKFTLLETQGKHEDTKELRMGAYRWMNRWLKNETGDVTEAEMKRHPPEELKVFSKIPEGALNATIQDYFIKPAQIDLPQSPKVTQEWWNGQKAKWQEALKEKVFAGWTQTPPKIGLRPVGDRSFDGVRLRAFDFTSEEGVDLRLWVQTATEVETPSLLILNVLDEIGYEEWCRDLGPEYQELLQISKRTEPTAMFAQNRRVMQKEKWAFAAIAPRGIGPTRWAVDGSPNDIQIRRRFALIGQTLDGQRVWDVRRAVTALQSVIPLDKTPLWLQGKNDMAGIALYASFGLPEVKRLDLWNLPKTHKDGPIFLNIRRHFDLPQALALGSDKKIMLYVRDANEQKTWEWPLSLQKALGMENLKLRVVGE